MLAGASYLGPYGVSRNRDFSVRAATTYNVEAPQATAEERHSVHEAYVANQSDEPLDPAISHIVAAWPPFSMSHLARVVDGN